MDGTRSVGQQLCQTAIEAAINTLHQDGAVWMGRIRLAVHAALKAEGKVFVRCDYEAPHLVVEIADQPEPLYLPLPPGYRPCLW